MNEIIIVIVVVLVVMFYINKRKGQNVDANSTVQNISNEQLRIILKDNPSVQLVDVRTPAETKGGIIETAVKINFFSKDFATRFTGFDKEKPIYLYCRSGNRSGKAAAILEKEGFSKVFNLLGGYSAW